MIIDESHKHKFMDLLYSAIEQPELINRIIFEVDPIFKKSKLDYLLPNWPIAVYPKLFANTELDKIQRAKDILSKIVKCDLSGKTFLDFGCGEGHVVEIAKETASMAIGYDICPRGNTTDNFNYVKRHAPYDIILIYDVLDHLIDDKPEVILDTLKNILSEDGMIFIRYHPWCSKHGTHVYKTFNKAYIHFFYSDEELYEMGHNPLPTFKIVDPIEQYTYWHSKNNLFAIHEFAIRSEITDFFLDPYLSGIMKYTGKRENMEIEFIDFTLVKNG